MEIPETVRAAVVEAEGKNQESPSAAITAAIRAVRKLPEFEAFVNVLVDHAVQQIVYECRGNRNDLIRRQQGTCHTRPAVPPGKYDDVQKVYESVYQYSIGGTTLGNLTGETLAAMLPVFAATAAVNQFHHRLGVWLQGQGVTGKRSVAEVVPEKKLQAAFRRLQAEGGREKLAA